MPAMFAHQITAVEAMARVERESAARSEGDPGSTEPIARRLSAVYADRPLSGKSRVLIELALSSHEPPLSLPSPMSDTSDASDIRDLPTTAIVVVNPDSLIFWQESVVDPVHLRGSRPRVKIMREFTAKSVAPLMRDPPSALVMSRQSFTHPLSADANSRGFWPRRSPR